MSENKLNMLNLLKKYEAIIKQFVVEEKGCFVVYTDDPIVVKALRNLSGPRQSRRHCGHV